MGKGPFKYRGEGRGDSLSSSGLKSLVPRLQHGQKVGCDVALPLQPPVHSLPLCTPSISFTAQKTYSLATMLAYCNSYKNSIIFTVAILNRSPNFN